MTAPPAPGGLKTSVVSETAVTLVWADTSGAELGFRIERCQGAGCLVFAVVGQVGANVVSFADAGVSASTFFRYRVRAFSASGESPPSNIVEATTAPSAPANLTAAAVSTNQINLAWVAGGGETGFRIERCIGTGCVNFSQIAEVGGGVTTFVSSGLLPGSTYRYRVRAFSSGGQSAFSNIAEAGTAMTAPAAPASLVATATAAMQITVRWNDVAGDTGVRIERCAGTGCATFAAVGQVAGNVTTFIDSGVTAAALYRYRVRAFNAGGDSLRRISRK